MFSLVTILLIIILCVFVYRIWAQTHNFDQDRNPTLGDALEGLRLYGFGKGVKTNVRIVFNGREYANIGDMHPEDRRAYDQLIGKLSGSDTTGLIDTSTSNDGATNKPAQLESTPREDPVETLRKLKDMKYAGLITEDDYEAKKAEILARM
jgi:Short C-terminal domain